jgi:hypothetical protein
MYLGKYKHRCYSKIRLNPTAIKLRIKLTNKILNITTPQVKQFHNQMLRLLPNGAQRKKLWFDGGHPVVNFDW